MESPVLRRVCREAGMPDLLERLSERVTPSDLQALFLELARMRAANRGLPALRAQHERDRNVTPSRADPRSLERLVVAALDATPAYDAIELSPVEPLGLNSQLAGVHQNNVLATVRGTELVADPTVPLALEAARRRRDGVDVVRVCAAHRVLRQQPFDPPALQHFLLFAMVTATRTRSDHTSEVDALVEHVRSYLAIVAAARDLGASVRRTVVRISDTVVHTAAMEAGATVTADVSAPREALPADIPRRLGRRLRRLEVAAEALAPVVAELDGELLIDLTRTHAVGYYDGLQLNIDGVTDGEPLELADGGSVDWTARLLSDRREHLFTSGLGLERLLPDGG